MDKEDVKLSEMFRSDQEKAFRELFIRYYKPMVLAARIYTNNHPESEDIVQQFFAKFWEEKLFKTINTSLRNYLQVSVRNACFNHLQREKKLHKQDINPLLEHEVEQAVDFLLQKEEIHVFELAYNKLPAQSRKVFELVYFSNQSYNDTAQILELSINTVKSHLKNALRILKNSSLLNNYYSDRKKF